VSYAGVNPVDYKNVERLTVSSPYPAVVGIDFAGTVEGVPTGAHDLQVGDRIFGSARTHGAYAEYTAVAPGAKTEPLARIPDGVREEQAAALPIPALTALGALELMEVSAGQSLVVMGANGGVGGYAVQMARSRGVHVIATVRSDADEAGRLGAEEVVDTRSVEMVSALHASHPQGVDAVLDLVNGPYTIRHDAEVLRPEGRLVSALHAADEAWFAARRIRAQNIGVTTNPSSSPEGLEQLARMLVDGTITARIRSTVGLDQAGRVLDRLRQGGLRGKALIRL
jgi:NADPH:quinone reductase-like Zn-dependent oxidoreductase